MARQFVKADIGAKFNIWDDTDQVAAYFFDNNFETEIANIDYEV